MTRATTQLKLGLLVLCAIAAAFAIAVSLGLRARTPTVRYHTYFDESVSGLDVGSVVEFRGVRIGSVGDISIAPDHNHIDVALDINQNDALEMHLDEVALAFRARLETSGITGVKYIDLEPRVTAKLPELAFAPDRRYVPSRPSMLHMLEANVQRVGESIPLLAERASAAADKVGRLLDDVERERLATRLATTLDHADAAFDELHRLVRHVDRADLPRKADATLAEIDAAAAKVRGSFTRLDGDGELARAMRELGSAARAFRELVQEVERDPDMLVKGRARSRRP
jgi:ABC-type transporter Mla subunit MlaD